MMFPTPHIASRVSEGFDQPGSLNQSGPSMPSLPSTVLTGPVAGFRR